MPKLPAKACPKCGMILERIYNRQHIANTHPYVPIGYRCPVCAESMTVYDRGYRQEDGFEGLTCPDCKGKMLVIQGTDHIRCLKCKKVFGINPIDDAPSQKERTYQQMEKQMQSDRSIVSEAGLKAMKAAESVSLHELTKQQPPERFRVKSDRPHVQIK